MIKNIVFDFDGTLADTSVFIENFTEIEGLNTQESFKKIRDNGLESLLKNNKIPTWKVPYIIYKYRAKINKNITKAKTFEGIFEVLNKLKEEDYQMGIISTNSNKNIREFLKINKMEYFEFIYTSSLFGKHKVIKKILKEYKIKPDEMIYVGDEDRDINAARMTGTKIISVSWGYNSKELLLKNKPDYIVDSPFQIPIILTNLR